MTGRRVSSAIGTGILAIFIAGALTRGPAVACELVAGPRGIVSEIVDGVTLRLESGLEVRLVNIAAPDLERALQALGNLALNHEVELRYGGTRTDRRGRALAHVYRIEATRRVWLQDALVASGLAYVQSFKDNRACVGELLAREDVARQGQVGAWGGPQLSVGRADRPAALGAAADRFQIVEGRIVSTGRTRRWVYLNFGRAWKSDFTGLIGAGSMSMFAAAGLDPLKFAGRHVRVRGWIEDRDGPAIEIDHPEQIELIGDGERVE